MYSTSKCFRHQYCSYVDRPLSVLMKPVAFLWKINEYFWLGCYWMHYVLSNEDLHSVVAELFLCYYCSSTKLFTMKKIKFTFFFPVRTSFKKKVETSLNGGMYAPISIVKKLKMSLFELNVSLSDVTLSVVNCYYGIINFLTIKISYWRSTYYY